VLERPISPKYFVEKVFDPIKKAGGKLKKITMNVRDYPDIRMFGRDVLDFVTERELLRKGFQATMYGIEVWTSREVEQNHFKLVVEKRGRTSETTWCPAMKLPITGSFCLNPDCVVEHVHDS
jgi:hypothetical protein